ncbi:unnamed protein product [Nyctereutes procyonoides]|uniref:(raccoon dog) hypothetical protein n=1 Tax=Nyctereutes procyonoides TaxID=34880 RepID=A0A811YNP7_NYCPR|nr:unnamed protein product [Nyctereutes procyonoides]
MSNTFMVKVPTGARPPGFHSHSSGRHAGRVTVDVRSLDSSSSHLLSLHGSSATSPRGPAQDPPPTCTRHPPRHPKAASAQSPKQLGLALDTAPGGEIQRREAASAAPAPPGPTPVRGGPAPSRSARPHPESPPGVLASMTRLHVRCPFNAGGFARGHVPAGARCRRSQQQTGSGDQDHVAILATVLVQLSPARGAHKGRSRDDAGLPHTSPDVPLLLRPKGDGLPTNGGAARLGVRACAAEHGAPPPEDSVRSSHGLCASCPGTWARPSSGAAPVRGADFGQAACACLPHAVRAKPRSGSPPGSPPKAFGSRDRRTPSVGCNGCRAPSAAQGAGLKVTSVGLDPQRAEQPRASSHWAAPEPAGPSGHRGQACTPATEAEAVPHLRPEGHLAPPAAPKPPPRSLHRKGRHERRGSHTPAPCTTPPLQAGSSLPGAPMGRWASERGVAVGVGGDPGAQTPRPQVEAQRALGSRTCSPPCPGDPKRLITSFSAAMTRVDPCPTAPLQPSLEGEELRGHRSHPSPCKVVVRPQEPVPATCPEEWVGPTGAQSCPDSCRSRPVGLTGFAGTSGASRALSSSLCMFFSDCDSTRGTPSGPLPRGLRDTRRPVGGQCARARGRQPAPQGAQPTDTQTRASRAHACGPVGGRPAPPEFLPSRRQVHSSGTRPRLACPGLSAGPGAPHHGLRRRSRAVTQERARSPWLRTGSPQPTAAGTDSRWPQTGSWARALLRRRPPRRPVWVPPPPGAPPAATVPRMPSARRNVLCGEGPRLAKLQAAKAQPPKSTPSGGISGEEREAAKRPLGAPAAPSAEALPQPPALGASCPGAAPGHPGARGAGGTGGQGSSQGHLGHGRAARGDGQPEGPVLTPWDPTGLRRLLRSSLSP